MVPLLLARNVRLESAVPTLSFPHYRTALAGSARHALPPFPTRRRATAATTWLDLRRYRRRCQKFAFRIAESIGECAAGRTTAFRGGRRTIRIYRQWLRSRLKHIDPCF